MPLLRITPRRAAALAGATVAYRAIDAFNGIDLEMFSQLVTPLLRRLKLALDPVVGCFYRIVCIAHFSQVKIVPTKVGWRFNGPAHLGHLSARSRRGIPVE